MTRKMGDELADESVEWICGMCDSTNTGRAWGRTGLVLKHCNKCGNLPGLLKAQFAAVVVGEVGVNDLRDLGPMPVGECSEDPKADNSARAARAAALLVTYAQKSYGGDEEAETALNDVLCDLRHLADAIGADFEDQLRKSERNYEAEVLGGW